MVGTGLEGKWSGDLGSVSAQPVTEGEWAWGLYVSSPLEAPGILADTG